jgi:hypothetical protein
VKGYTGEFKEDKLKNARILIIANALNKLNTENWFLPTPSAFAPEEIRILHNWVKGGGSLFLIADHMPMGGAASDLVDRNDILIYLNDQMYLDGRHVDFIPYYTKQYLGEI